jgi:hypothetical protein
VAAVAMRAAAAAECRDIPQFPLPNHSGTELRKMNAQLIAPGADVRPDFNRRRGVVSAAMRMVGRQAGRVLTPAKWDFFALSTTSGPDNRSAGLWAGNVCADAAERRGSIPRPKWG